MRQVAGYYNIKTQHVPCFCLRSHDGSFLLVDLSHQAGPVLDRGVHASAVDEIEFPRVGPFGLHIVDFETHIRRHPGSGKLHAGEEWRLDSIRYHRGWIGLRSLPRTYAPPVSGPFNVASGAYLGLGVFVAFAI